MKKDTEKKSPEKNPGTEATTGPGCAEEGDEGPTAEVRLSGDVHVFLRQNFGDEAVHVAGERFTRLYSLAKDSAVSRDRWYRYWQTARSMCSFGRR